MITDPRDVIIAPVISEKSYGLLEERQEIFDVQVASVNTLNREGKRKRSRRGYGKRKATKRAVVTVTPDSRTIDVFGAPGAGS